MDTFTPPRGRRAGPGGQVTRGARTGLVLVAGLMAALLATACDTAEQVPWATYSEQLQTQIDSATATHSCAALQAFLRAAKATSHAHERATGFPNDALVGYIQAAQAQAGCPAGTG